MTLEKTFNPALFESEEYAHWQSLQAFAARGEGAPYCIMLPPPNVTGILHMGHAFQQTLMDILIRYHRMRGDQTLWQAGTDHAGIATQMVVERQLLQEGVRKETLGREAFLDKVWEWKAQSGDAIMHQMQTLGASADWSRSRFTLDDGLSQAVQTVFVRLYEEGLIYRGQRLVNWDPVLQTAVSDLEVDLQEEQGSLWYIRYPAVDGGPGLVIATTRPETLLGDVAVAVHPEDAKHQHLIGQHLVLPLCDRHIPVVADDSVEPEFGTGCVKITPAHDFNDYALGLRHGLPCINILTKTAAINDQAPTAYQGLGRFEAREKVLRDLKALGLLEKTEPYTLKIPRGDRTGEILEPFLTDQWFVKTKPLAEPAIKAVESGAIKFVPENWDKTYFEWMRNIEDWCISRQLWWGHRIPAWYDAEGKIYVGKNEAEVRTQHRLADTVRLTQDPDVLDTWFSSALWPFSTLGWPEQTPELQTFYPGNVLITGFDIIFFWVARMVMFGLKFTGKVPFQTVYIHGLIQDAYGQKMSKSKGNILDPMDLINGIALEALVQKRTTGLMQPQLAKKIEKDTRQEFPQGIPAFGTDALRFTFAALATSNRFIRFDLNRIEGYRNFCNKIWNAARYVLMNTVLDSEGAERGESFTEKPKQLTAINQWIIGRWQTAKAEVHRHLAQYRFDLAAQALYEFTWNEYCDWYLELSKPMFGQGSEMAKDKSAVYGTRHTLLSILEELLRVLHPFMPFITERLWKEIAPHCVPGFEQLPQKTIMLQAYPVAHTDHKNTEVETQIEFLKKMILEIRNIRGEMKISPKIQIPLLLRGPAHYQEKIASISVWLQSIAKVQSCEWLDAEQTIPPSATGLVEDLEIFIPMVGLIDHAQEITRLQKEIEKSQKEAASAEQKLANSNYIQKAPPAVVAAEKERLAALQQAIAKLTQRLTQLQEIARD